MNHIAWTKKKAAIALALCVIIAVSSVMILQNNPTTQAALVNPHPGLVGWWRFDEGTGTIASDSSGNGNNGAIYGIPNWVTGIYGNAISFPGNAVDYVRIPNSANLQITGDLTISCWVKVASLSKQALVYKYWGGEFALYLQTNGGVTFAQTSSESYVVSPGSVAAGVWTQIVVTRNAASKVITGYLNGVESLSYSYSVTPTSSTRDVLIGVEDAAFNPLNGVIDEVQIYSRVLSPAEIQSNSQTSPDFSPYILANVPAGATQVITTLSWQGTGNITVMITTPSQTYTESMMSIYQKTTYSTIGGGPLSMLNIKRLSITVAALSSAQSWNITLTCSSVSAYQIAVETQ